METKELYTVDIYIGKNIIGSITQLAETPEEASAEAFKSVNVKVVKSYLKPKKVKNAKGKE